MQVVEYGVGAVSYLQRCRERLLEDNKPALFYAALELRCCVEARLAEYVQHYDRYKGKKVQQYKIGENAKLVKKISAGEAIAQLTFNHSDGRVSVHHYTPVPKRLREYCEQRLDGLRHSQATFRACDDPWWQETRSDLVQGYRVAWLACQGDMPLPPLWDTKTGRTHPMIFYVNDENRDYITGMVNSVGQSMMVGVDYLDAPPAAWVCDL